MHSELYEREIVRKVLKAFTSKKNLIQVITGPRQVGKSTAAGQIGDQWQGKVFYASADSPLPPGHEWIRHHWERARREQGGISLLIMDEIQKVTGWSEVVKSLWDEDVRADKRLKVLLLGSSSLLINQGLTESLAGRFFLHRLPHWQFGEMMDAFGIDLDEWLYFGGYPGAVSFFQDEAMWKAYIHAFCFLPRPYHVIQ